ncbi:hypothetical protein [Leptolyngbya sp. NIES-2104]|uniref:hypothetical protein n=1 Tax=Leptolyngbya sp. NIES-2104 TaxID=1552121 RepID=UPI00092EC333|nr:hypothetical protein [Leptolyngbya sp. NIES-2104]
MNADTFDRDSNACPVCHRTGGLPSVKSVGGLLTCPHCRSRLVVSLSGHYVRDPFRTKKLSSQQLRKQSRPIARIFRDSGLAKHSPLLAIVGSLLVVSFSMAVLSQVERLPEWTEQIIFKDAETKN